MQVKNQIQELAGTLSPTAFADFAELSSDETDMREFAEEHGLRGLKVRDIDDRCMMMQLAISLWRAVEDEDVKQLRSIVEIEGGHAWHAVEAEYRPGSELKVRLAEHLRDEEETADEKRMLAARLLITGFANRELRGNVDHALNWNANRGKLVDEPIPRNLLGALWLQFARAVGAGASLRTCSQCDRWMLIGAVPGGRRRQSRFCSEACKQRTKNTKNRAYMMAAQGFSLRRISQETGISLKQLRSMGLT